MNSSEAFPHCAGQGAQIQDVVKGVQAKSPASVFVVVFAVAVAVAVGCLLCCCCCGGGCCCRCRCRCGCGCGCCCCCYPCSSFISLLVAKNRPQVVFPRFFGTPGANTHCKHRSLLRRGDPKAWYVRTFSFATVNKIAVFTFFCKRRAKTLVFQHVARSISWVERVR